MSHIVHKSPFLLHLEALRSPDEEARCWCSENKDTWLERLCFLAGLQELSRFGSRVYLSASDVGRGWVDLVGDETGLVAAPSPFCRQFLNSAILDGCKAALFLSNQMRSQQVIVWPLPWFLLLGGGLRVVPPLQPAAVSLQLGSDFLITGFRLGATLLLQPAAVSLQLVPHLGGTEHSCFLPI